MKSESNTHLECPCCNEMFKVNIEADIQISKDLINDKMNVNLSHYLTTEK